MEVAANRTNVTVIDPAELNIGGWRLAHGHLFSQTYMS